MGETVEYVDKSLKIMKYIERGENVMVHGLAGCGKTYSVASVVSQLKDAGKIVYCTAMTGIAAINFNNNPFNVSATTLHRWAGLGLCDKPIGKMYTAISTNKLTKYRWECDVLVIDEVSMLGSTLFETLYDLAIMVRCGIIGPSIPFGGIQVIAVGDFMQLPPVNDKWVFTSKKWGSMNFRPVALETPYRYNDHLYHGMLLNARMGFVTDEQHKQLKRRHKMYIKAVDYAEAHPDDIYIKPTVMYSTNANVDAYNASELAKLKCEGKVYYSQDRFKAKKGVTLDGYKKDMLIEQMNKNVHNQIKLKDGAQVMLTYNVDVDQGLANGSRGVVISMHADQVVVLFKSGLEFSVSYVELKEKTKYGKIYRTHMPLVLAWSSTIHRTQGCTIDCAEVDIGRSVFLPGQSYVAISRVSGYNDLFLKNYRRTSIFADKEAIAYTNHLKLMEALETESTGTWEELYETFYIDNGPAKEYPEYVPTGNEVDSHKQAKVFLEKIGITTRKTYRLWMRANHPDKTENANLLFVQLVNTAMNMVYPK